MMSNINILKIQYNIQHLQSIAIYGNNKHKMIIINENRNEEYNSSRKNSNNYIQLFQTSLAVACSLNVNYDTIYFKDKKKVISWNKYFKIIKEKNKLKNKKRKKKFKVIKELKKFINLKAFKFIPRLKNGKSLDIRGITSQAKGYGNLSTFTLNYAARSYNIRNIFSETIL